MTNVDVLVGDLFESRAQTLTNTVNTVGVMGKGIALGFKQRFPDMYEDYVRRCELGEVALGKPYLYRSLFPPWVLNFPTKSHWRAVTKLTDIQEGLEHLQANYREWGIESLAVPPLGCGEGHLEWRVVGPTLYRELTQLAIPVELYAPFGTPHAELQPDFLDGTSDFEAPAPRISAAAVALAAIVDRIHRSLHHYPIGRTSFQKIAYFATEAGIPTGLEYERRSFGPFAEGVKRLTSQLLNNGLLLEEKRGSMFRVMPGPTIGDGINAYKHDLLAWEDQIDSVADLFLRLPTTKDAELAASAHYVGHQLKRPQPDGSTNTPTESAVIDEVARWKSRRDPAPDREDLVRAVRTLSHLGWLEAATEDADEGALV